METSYQLQSLKCDCGLWTLDDAVKTAIGWLCNMYRLVQNLSYSLNMILRQKSQSSLDIGFGGKRTVAYIGVYKGSSLGSALDGTVFSRYSDQYVQ